MRRVSVIAAVVVLLFGSTGRADEVAVGISALDITPDYPVRLSGFGFRRTESEGVTQRIWAKAIAIGQENPAVIVTVDNLGVPSYMRQDVAQRLAKKANLDPNRFAITSSHTHTAPMLTNVCRTLFGRPIVPDEQARIDRYTKELADYIEKAALAALDDRKPARLEFGIGAGDLAMNRRTKGGPVDHDLPVLAVRAPDGKLRGVYVSYACHCVTLSNNKVSGDWAGFLQEQLQKDNPGAIALTSVGCGADSNPKSGVTGEKVDIAADQGKKLAAEVQRMLKAGGLAPIEGKLDAKATEVELMFDTPPTREKFQKTADANQEYVSYHAKVQLERLDRGEALQAKLPYLIQTWTFGDDLAMVFLPGEVVVDYSLRLKREFDRARLWVNAYSNDVPCYIPSERILKEGGYEGGGAMTFYDRPTRLASGVEQKIIDEVHRQLPETFAAPKGTEGVAPKSPEASLRTIRTKPGLEIELVAAEPLVTSPVAIDWGANGKLWVCEMFDYPTGVDQNWQPGGRVKFLEDTDGDGRYDKATVFIENLPFPTGVTAWGKGVFVCAAPDILYAQDTNGDGKADKVERVFSGFDTDNYQARVNSLSLGLDNWVYAANGLRGGTITNPAGTVKIDIRGHDFRFRPMGGPLETLTGLTQQGRVRDDWGRWFGCDNSNALFYYPHEARYLSRNPHAPAPPPTIHPPAENPGRIYPISRLLERFNHPDGANHMTSACGLGVYRDTALGEEYFNNAFVSEPVHNLVHRMIVSGDEPNLKRSRAADERESEFLASTDNWFRPVQVRTGPDGALYVVDMYRFLIEHPRWIPAERMAKIDARAGADKGRIYRMRRKGAALPAVADLTKLDTKKLAESLGSSSGTERDRAHVQLLVRQDRAAVPTLESLATTSKLPQVRVQALCAIDGLGGLNPPLLVRCLKDPDAQVRKHAVRLSEKQPIEPALLAMANDESRVVRHQLAYALGESNDLKAGETLGRLAAGALADAEMRTAVLSSSKKHCGEVLRAVMAAPTDSPGRDAWVAPLVATAAASDDPALLAGAVLAVLPPENIEPTAAHFDVLASLLQALDGKERPGLGSAKARITHVLAAAGRLAADDSAVAPARASAVRLLGFGQPDASSVDLLCNLASGATTAAPEVRTAAVAALRRQQSPEIAGKLLGRWRNSSPAARTDLVNLLLARDEWAAALLAAVRDRRVGRNEISLAERQRLLTSTNEKLRADAVKTFPAESESSRAEVLTRYASVPSLTGDAAKGRELFAQHCASCHRLGEVGHVVGPDLALLRDKEADYWVKNILDPSAIVEPRFVNYQVITKDRRTIAGIIATETSTGLTMLAGNGVTENVARADVKEIRATAVSMMPEGLEAAMSPQQLADLVAHLKQSAAAPLKQFPGNSPQTVAAAADGSLVLPASSAEICGRDIEFESQFKNVGSWHGQGDHVAWTVRTDKPREFDVHFDYSCDENTGGNEFVVAAGEGKLTGAVKATGPGWSWYRQVKVGRLTLPEGEHRLTVRPAGQVRGALLDLRTVALTPVGVAPHWPEGVRAPRTPDRVARDPAAVAAIILDTTQSNEAREAAVNSNPQFAAELIDVLSKDIPAGDTKLEYERIPWIWRVAVLSGKRNDAETIRKVLAVSLPKEGEPLRDWQSVVIGGGIINGISQRGTWPAARVAEIIGDDDGLKARWQRALDLADAMTDDEKVRSGTRYDSLRMLGCEPWEKRGEHLIRYLAKGTHAELQMGAVSALADVDSPKAAEALTKALPHLTPENRKLAEDGLKKRKASSPAPTGFQDILAKPILEPGTPLSEVQAFCESRIPGVPDAKNVKDWESHAAQIRKDVLEKVVFRGVPAAWRDSSALKVEWLDTIPGGPGYSIRKLRYEAIPGLWVPALLYVPEKLAARAPVVVNFNGHVGAEGKAIGYKQLICINQAKRGMLALNVEWLGMGQLADAKYGHNLLNQLDLCGVSGVAPFYLLMTRALDVLLAHPNADPTRVAVTGLSGGGWQTIVHASLDTRVTLAVPVAGYSSLRTRARHLGDLGDAEQTPNDLATVADYAHLTALLAPRPSLLIYNSKDECCFASAHALPPLIDAAAPVFSLYGKRESLRAHVNEVPGTHNYEKDNREAFYKMVGDHFFAGDASYTRAEIPSETEIKSFDELRVELPKDNLTLNGLAHAAAKDLPKKNGAKRETLREVVRFRDDLSLKAEQVDSSEAGGVSPIRWRLKIDPKWTLPAVEFKPAAALTATTIVINDAGRKASGELVDAALKKGHRVVAVDLFSFGESAPPSHGYLLALLVAATGERPLGVEASQLARVARWLKESHKQPVTVVASGPRSTTVARVAAALQPDAIEKVELHNALDTFKELIEKNRSVEQMPDLFCFGLLESFDVPQLDAMVKK